MAQRAKNSKRQNASVEESRELLNSYLANTALMLSTPVRLALLTTLVQAPRSVEELAETTGQSMANVSQHLAKLKNAHLVQSEKKGIQRVYTLASPLVQKVVVALQELAREISSEVVRAEAALVAPELRAHVSLNNVLADVAENRAELIDVRTSHEQTSTPVEFALRIPVEDESDLKKVLKAASKNKPVYVFCRGAYCITASRTAEFLRENGIQAWCLRETAVEFSLASPNSKLSKQKQPKRNAGENEAK
ncbi:ArsR family transcriptional regulator [bacterium]|nr:ArsR family transcriptional regulator [bacterium]